MLEHFEKNRKGEWFKTCNNCRKVNRDSFKNYREEHKEQELQRNRQYRTNNIEALREKGREKDKIRSARRTEERKEYKHKYHQEHKETINQKKKKRTQTQ